MAMAYGVTLLYCRDPEDVPTRELPRSMLSLEEIETW